jgi:transposase
MLAGVAPIPASSGKTTRHRLSRGGDRAANNALHRIALVRWSHDPRTRDYVARQLAAGRSKKDVKCPRFCSDLYRRIRSMPRQYSPEFRQRALRLLDTMMEAPDISEFEAIKSVASKLGISEESVRRWRRKAQVDAGERPGTTSSEHAEIRKLKREVSELRRANEILKSASAFFAAELDRPVTK